MRESPGITLEEPIKQDNGAWKIDPHLLLTTAVLALTFAYGYGSLTNRQTSNELATARATVAIEAVVTTLQAERDQRAALQATVMVVEAQMREREKRFDLEQVHARMRQNESDMRSAARTSK